MSAARRHSGRRLLLLLILLLGGARTLPAHTFPGITADGLFVGDSLVLTLDLHVLDVIAILDGESLGGQQQLTRAQFEAGLPFVEAYLARTLRLSVAGREVAGRCLGLTLDLGGLAADAPVPVRLPFVLAWAPPREALALDLAFTLLPKQLAGGVLLATLHRGMKVQSQLVEIGHSAHFAITPESALAQELAGTPGYGGGAEPGERAAVVESSGLGAGELLGMGFRHIVPDGLDHILFVVCLFLLSPRLKPLLLQVTAFTIAHSVTLGLAMAGVVLLPSRLVETLIALSIVVMALENLVMREVTPWRWLLVFLFGLVHGLGFAGSFSALRLAPGDFTRSLVLLNLGIECAQLSVVALAAAATCWCWQRRWYVRGVVIPASVLIAAVAAWWTVARAFAL
jgi:hypothetical protein